eukprot:11188372-Lingulodinium_polyedra.AAC.1
MEHCWPRVTRGLFWLSKCATGKYLDTPSHSSGKATLPKPWASHISATLIYLFNRRSYKWLLRSNVGTMSVLMVLQNSTRCVKSTRPIFFGLCHSPAPQISPIFSACSTNPSNRSSQGAAR